MTDDSNSQFKHEWLLKNFCLDILSDQNQKYSDKCQFWWENVQCPTTISSTAHYKMTVNTLTKLTSITN